MKKVSAPVFCEMLGRVCHKSFYENNEMEYQEVQSIVIEFDFRRSSFMENMMFYVSITPNFRMSIST